MAKKKASSNAAPSALGYLYQSRYALLNILSSGDDPARSISIEKLDDVAELTLDPNSGKLSKVEMFQLKHHIKRKGGTTNSHSDVWGTLKIWATAVQKKQIDLEDAKFFIITTSKAASSHAIGKLRDDATRSPEVARKKLEAAGAKSKNETVKKAHKTLLKLSKIQRTKLFSKIYLVEDSPDITQVRAKLEDAVWQAVSKDRASAFVDRLEGWWLNQVIVHLFDSKSQCIPVQLVREQIHTLRDEFMSDNLPADFLVEPVPKSETDEQDSRKFVRQLVQVGVKKKRIKVAQENHYRAVAQRAKWLRSELLHISDLDQFEQRLEMEWNEFYQMMLDDLEDDASESELSKSGRNLYNWSQNTAPDKQSLFIKPRFQSAYFTRGSYQMLADQVRIGWHRDYEDLFDEPED